jgi:hypothetical protein
VISSFRAMSGEKCETTIQNPNFSIVNWLFIEIIRLVLEFLFGIENF